MLIDSVANQRWFPALPTETLLEIKEKGLPQPYSDTDALRALVRAAVPFAVHNLAHHFYEDNKDKEWSMDDFPRPVPPFDISWFEWGAPGFLIDGCNFERMGCLVFKHPGLSKGSTFASMPFIQRRGGDIGSWPISVWATDDNGGLLEIEGIRADATIKTVAQIFAGSYYESLSDAHKDALSYLSLRMTHPVLFALSLLHCKNATQRDAIQDPQLIKARARRGLWSRSLFKVIEIRPIGRRASSSHGSGSSKRATIRRGHFKNYKEGAGLFGKIHGLYWWDQFIEGEASQAAYKFNKSMTPALELVNG